MNDTKKLIEKTEEKVNKLRTLTLLLIDLEKAANSELLEPATRDQCRPIIKEVMEKINQVSRQ